MKAARAASTAGRMANDREGVERVDSIRRSNGDNQNRRRFWSGTPESFVEAVERMLDDRIAAIDARIRDYMVLRERNFPDTKEPNKMRQYDASQREQLSAIMKPVLRETEYLRTTMHNLRALGIPRDWNIESEWDTQADNAHDRFDHVYSGLTLIL